MSSRQDGETLQATGEREGEAAELVFEHVVTTSQTGVHEFQEDWWPWLQVPPLTTSVNSQLDQAHLRGGE